MISGFSAAYWEVLCGGASIFSLAVSLQYSSEYDGRISTMAFNINITWWISGFTEVLKQDSARGKASSKGVVLNAALDHCSFPFSFGVLCSVLGPCGSVSGPAYGVRSVFLCGGFVDPVCIFCTSCFLFIYLYIFCHSKKKCHFMGWNRIYMHLICHGNVSDYILVYWRLFSPGWKGEVVLRQLKIV